jgi:sugar lactone lactonase YvrE
VINLSGKAGYSGDGATDAQQAQLNGPKYLGLDAQGNVLICDTENHAIRRYLPAKNKVELLVGTPGKSGTSVGATGLETQLKRPHGVRVYKEWLYIADSENNRVLRLPYELAK